MPASPSTARAMNDRLALRLLQEQGPLTAGRLKELTGLSRPTVADLVARLQTSGLVRVVGETGAQRRGPNARLYAIVADRAHLAALDVRTDSVRVGVADLLGSLLAEASLPVGGDTGTEPAVERAVTLLERTAERAGAARLHHVVVGAPGLVDPATGELRATGGLPAWHGRLVAALQDRLAAHVLVENETNLAAVAEARVGSAHDRDTFVFCWFGHGTGAAVVLDGQVRRGVSGGAGEIGFLPVPGTAGLPSATGCAGGFDSLVSGAAVAALAAEHGITEADAPELAGSGTDALAAAVPEAAVTETAVTETSAPEADRSEDGRSESGRPGAGPVAEQPPGRRGRSLPGQRGTADPSAPPAAALVAAALSQGPRGDAFLDALADRMALGAAAVAAVLDPGCVVLGGEVGRAGGKALAVRVEERLAALSPLRTEVRAGTLGGSAVLRGALLVARDAAQDEIFGSRP